MLGLDRYRVRVECMGDFKQYIHLRSDREFLDQLGLGCARMSPEADGLVS